MSVLRRKIKRAKMLAGIATGARPLTGPQYVLFRINHSCNMKCMMCSSFSELIPEQFRISQRNDMDFDFYCRLIDDCVRLDVERVSIGGEGEPALHPRFMDMLQYAKDKDLEGMAITNGSRLTRQSVERLVDMKWDELNVSMNAGNKAAHEAVTLTRAWDRISDGLLYMAELKKKRGQSQPLVRISNTIFNKNYKSITDMVRFAIEAAADEMTIGLATLDDYPNDGRNVLAMTPGEFSEARELLAQAGMLAGTSPRLKHNIDEFIETIGEEKGQLRITESVQLRIPCTVGYWLTVIDPTGPVHPCCQCEDSLGSASGSSNLCQVWSSEPYARFRKAARDLPKRGRSLDNCTCHSCDFTQGNIHYYNKLHPLRKIADLSVSPRR